MNSAGQCTHQWLCMNLNCYRYTLSSQLRNIYKQCWMPQDIKSMVSELVCDRFFYVQMAPSIYTVMSIYENKTLPHQERTHALALLKVTFLFLIKAHFILTLRRSLCAAYVVGASGPLSCVWSSRGQVHYSVGGGRVLGDEVDTFTSSSLWQLERELNGPYSACGQLSY